MVRTLVDKQPAKAHLIISAGAGIGVPFVAHCMDRRLMFYCVDKMVVEMKDVFRGIWPYIWRLALHNFKYSRWRV